MAKIFRILVNGPMGSGKTRTMNNLNDHPKLTDEYSCGYDSYDREWKYPQVMKYDMDSFFNAKDHELLRKNNNYDETHEKILNRKIKEVEQVNKDVKIFIYFGLIEYKPTNLFFDKQYMLLPPIETVLKFYYKRASSWFEPTNIIGKPLRPDINKIHVFSSDSIKEQYDDIVTLSKDNYEVHNLHDKLENSVADYIISIV
jgi:hypothetical protein